MTIFKPNTGAPLGTRLGSFLGNEQKSIDHKSCLVIFAYFFLIRHSTSLEHYRSPLSSGYLGPKESMKRKFYSCGIINKIINKKVSISDWEAQFWGELAPTVSTNFIVIVDLKRNYSILMYYAHMYHEIL